MSPLPAMFILEQEAAAAVAAGLREVGAGGVAGNQERVVAADGGREGLVEDNEADTLTGARDLDWFLATLDDAVDQAVGERNN